MAPASRIRLKHFLPQVFLATSLVVLVPSVIGWALRGTGIIDSEWVAIALVVLLSLAASDLGGRYWKTRSASGDLLFSELMVWGWLRRWWKERRLASVLVLLGGVESEAANDHQDRERRAQLLVDLADALEASDPYTHGHSHRVARHAEMVAVGMGLSDRDTAKIRTAAALHDVGKIHTPMAILHKPGRLTTEEFEVIKRHPAAGATMVAALGDPELEAMVRQHHERMDGSGYPARLAGQEICVGARIIAVADTFDAITSRRPYRSTKTHREALQILASEAGVTLDPNAVRGFQGYYWGRRPLAVWVSLTNIVGRLASSLGGGANLTVASVSRVVAASALTGASAAAISLPVLAAARPPSPDSGSVSAVPAALSVHGNPLPGSSGSPARQAAGAGGQAAHLGPSRVATGRGAATTGPSATAAVAVIPGLGVTLSPRTGATASGGPGVVLVTPSAGGGTVSAPSSGSPGQPASLGGGGGGSSSPAVTTPAQGSTPTTEGRSGGGQGQGGGSGGQGGGGSGQGGGSGDGGSGGQGQGSGQGGGSGDGGGQGQGGGSSQGQGGGSGQGGGFAGGGSGNSGGSGGAGGSGDGGQGQGGGGGSGGQGQGGGQGNGGGGSDSGGAQGNGGGSGKGHTSST